MECRNSPIKMFGLLMLTTLMVAASVFVATRPSLIALIVGCVGAAFFSLGYIFLPMQMARAGPIVIINDKGIEDTRLNRDVIRWEDISDISVVSIHSTKLLHVGLHDPEAFINSLSTWRQKAARANAALGYSPLTISFGGLTPGIDEVWAYVQERYVDV